MISQIIFKKNLQLLVDGRYLVSELKKMYLNFNLSGRLVKVGSTSIWPVYYHVLFFI
jgi:hypothetical protein